MNDIKLTASFILPGRVIEGSDSYQNESLEVYDVDSKKTSIIKYRTRIPLPAEQVIKVSEQTFNHWMEHRTTEHTSVQWKKMPERLKVISHLKEIQCALGATTFKFHIFE